MAKKHIVMYSYEGMGRQRNERSEAKPRGKVEERKRKKFRFLIPFLNSSLTYLLISFLYPIRRLLTPSSLLYIFFSLTRFAWESSVFNVLLKRATTAKELQQLSYPYHLKSG
jgi:hypothetical protein